MLGNSKLIDLLKEYPKDKITEKMYKSCKRILKENEKYDISVENMATKSQSGTGLLIWVLAILNYYEASKNVEPLQIKVEDMQQAQSKTKIELGQLKDLLKQLDDELVQLRSRHREASNELSILQMQASKMEKRLATASTFIEGLVGERARWTKEIKILNSTRSLLVSDCLLAAGFISYMGPFTAQYRQELMVSSLRTDLNDRQISTSENFKVQNMFLNETDVQKWSSDGLPPDEHSIQNGILTMKATDRFPLCIDPQQQASSWLKNTFKGQQLIVKALYDREFMKHLELCIEFGNAFLFENVGEEIDPILTPILEKKITTIDSEKLSRLEKKHCESFKLFQCTKLRNPIYPPYIMGKVTLVNYCINKDGLCEQLRNTVVSHERPELEMKYVELVKSITTNEIMLVALEESLLKELSSSSGNILENDDLICTLNETKAKAAEIKQRIEELRQARLEISTARDFYREVSERGSNLYFASLNLSSLDPMYEISLDKFLEQFNIALSNSKFAENENNRIRNLIDSCTKMIVSFTCAGIFERHKLAFMFNLTCMILDQRERLESNVMNFFMKGDTSLDTAIIIKINK